MRKEKCIKEVKDGYVFCIYPTNSNRVCLGESSLIYADYADCMNGLNKFIRFVTVRHLNKEDGKNVVIKKRTSHKTGLPEFIFLLYDDDGNELLHRTSGYTAKKGCQKGIDSLYRNLTDLATEVGERGTSTI